MLETVLDAYLAALPNERDFDAPFLALLPAMGFYDVRYTHGAGEFGKDFIAKKRENKKVVQYSFQLKRDVHQSEWRDVQNQILEAAISPLTHPHFDATLPHQPVLVTTGRLSNNAAIGGTNLNEKLRHLKTRALEVWERPQLVRELTAHGLKGVHQSTASGVKTLGRFYSLYGDALEAKASPRDIEKYSRVWLHVPLIEIWPPTPEALATAPAPDPNDVKARLLGAALESALLSSCCISSNLYYEGLVCSLAAWRAVLHAWDGALRQGESDLAAHCQSLHQRMQEQTLASARKFVDWVEMGWRNSNRQLVLRVADVAHTPAQISSYPVHCARIVEILGLLFFLDAKSTRRDHFAALLAEFVEQEPGCARPIGDYYAVSYVWPLLALTLSGRRTNAFLWWQELALWMLDRFEQGKGIARLESSPLEEVTTLFGYAFDFLKVESTSTNFLATILADFAVWLGEAQAYEDFVSDLEVMRIYPQYVQPPDSEGLFRFEAPDVNRLASVSYEIPFSPFNLKEFASHIRLDKTSYALSGQIGLGAFISLSLLLRDRAFPGLWPVAPNI